MNYVIGVLLAALLIFGLVSLLNDGLERSLFKSRQEDSMKDLSWAYGSAEDAIKIIETIRADPLRLNAESVYEGVNERSGYSSTGRIRFRGTTFVYKSYKDYKQVLDWLKKHPSIEPASKPSW